MRAFIFDMIGDCCAFDLEFAFQRTFNKHCRTVGAKVIVENTAFHELVAKITGNENVIAIWLVYLVEVTPFTVPLTSSVSASHLYVVTLLIVMYWQVRTRHFRSACFAFDLELVKKICENARGGPPDMFLMTTEGTLGQLLGTVETKGIFADPAQHWMHENACADGAGKVSGDAFQ